MSVQVIGCLSATFRTQPRSEGAGHKKCFMDSKGDGKHFFLACVFGLPELGLLWCLAFSDPLPTSFIFVSVQVIGCLSATFRTQPRSEGDSKGDGKHFFWLVFLACLSSACCGVWPFRIRCPRASFLCLCRL